MGPGEVTTKDNIAGKGWVVGHAGLKRIEIDEDFARAGAVFGSDDAFFFHEIHDAGGTIVADAKPTLDHGSAGAFGRFEDVEGLVVEFFVVAEVAVALALAVFFGVLARGAIDLGLDRLGVLRRAVFLQEFDHGHDLFIGDEGALGADEPRTAGG